MKWILYCFIMIMMTFSVLGTDFYIINNRNIDSFLGLEKSTDPIYVGSSIRYNISFYYNGTNKLGTQEFQIQIFNSNKDVIEEQTFSFDIMPNKNYSISSSLGNDMYKLIYAEVPGVYKLNVVSKSLHFYESIETGFRQDKQIPIFFEVRGLEEKRLIEANKEIIKTSESIAKESGEINKKLLDLTNNIYLATLAMLIVALLTLYVSPNGKQLLVNIIKWILYIIVAVMVLIIIYQLLS